MLKKIVIALLFSAACSLFVSTAQSNAQCQSSCLWNSGIRSGNNIIASKPPYFAMHPPVYYDRIVPRAYGISPFAVPPGVMPVENTVEVLPKAVSNPFFKNKSDSVNSEKVKPANREQEFKVTAKRITNPFYLQKVVSSK